jgi:hypothetical protein
MEKDKVNVLKIDFLIRFSPISYKDATYLGEKRVKGWLYGHC